MITEKPLFLKLDNLNNIYKIYENRIEKLNEKGVKLSEYSFEEDKIIKFVDVSDSHKILVYFESNNQIIYLDNKMCQIGDSINMFDIYDNDFSCLINSNYSGIIIYDEFIRQVVKINEKGKLIDKSNLRNNIFDNSVVDKLVELNNKLYLKYENKGLLILDENLLMLNLISIPNIEDFWVYRNTIYYTIGKKIFVFNNQQSISFNFDYRKPYYISKGFVYSIKNNEVQKDDLNNNYN
ncbi:MAG: hypothetical protein N4A49_14185 [Marinifilaceae bacterium]|nr:hypothetical protein [Marinifilaceae bacterium]